MAASVQKLIESLEVHLERNQQEIEALRQENARLKEALARKAPSALDEPVGQPEAVAPALQNPPEEASKPHPQNAEVATPGAQSKALPVHDASKSAPATAEASPPSPHALLKQWYERYPNAFFTGHTKPLKVGIHHDLAEREPWSGKLIRRALANYVNLPRYVKSMREGAERVDLEGAPAGKVDREAALHASERRKEPSGDKTGPQGPKKPRHKAPGGSKPPAKTQGEGRSRPVGPAFPAGADAEKSDEKKPLSMEEKIKGLLQKFEGR